MARRRLTGRLSASKPSRAPTKSYSLTNYCTVSGRCRSCTSGTKLFNDALRRILQVAASSINNASFNQCESSPVPASAFNNATLSNLHDAGISDVIRVSVSNGSPFAIEPTPTILPSRRPSQVSQPQPTSQDTVEPTPFPNVQTTTMHSTEPTSKPSLPSLNKPVVAHSPEHSLSPSGFPLISAFPSHGGPAPFSSAPGFSPSITSAPTTPPFFNSLSASPNAVSAHATSAPSSRAARTSSPFTAHTSAPATTTPPPSTLFSMHVTISPLASSL